MGVDAHMRYHFLQEMASILPEHAANARAWADTLQAAADHASDCGICSAGYICPSFQVEVEEIFADQRLPVHRRLRRYYLRLLKCRAFYVFRDPANASTRYRMGGYMDCYEPAREQNIRRQAAGLPLLAEHLEVTSA